MTKKHIGTPDCDTNTFEMYPKEVFKLTIEEVKEAR
jgi:hypothetical protein